MGAALTVLFPCVQASSGVKAPRFPTLQWKDSFPTGGEGWEDMKIDYRLPASPRSHYGTPLGNGFFGVEQSGDPGEDVFQLNHKGFWSGDPEYSEYIQQGNAGFKTTRAQRKDAWEKTRKLLTEAYVRGLSPEARLAKMKEAEAAAKGMWCASYQATYLPMGNLRVRFPGHGEGFSDYRRFLDMDGATGHVSYAHEGVTYTREAFASHPDKVMAVRFTNDKEVPMNLEVSFDLPPEMTGKSPDNKTFLDSAAKEVVMTGRAPIVKTGDGGQWFPDRGVTFEARARVLAAGGTVTCGEGRLTVSGAKEVVLLFSCETSYKDGLTNPARSGIDVAGNVRRAIDGAAGKSWNALLGRHRDDFRSLFRRLWLDMGGSPILSGNRSIKPEEYVRYYQYGRYIMISGERENTQDLPLNLCGLWNCTWSPPNESAYFLNENLQKMHALAGPGNLSDTAEPYWKWIGNIASRERGGKTALESFGIKDAWAVSHSSDAWAKTEFWGDETRWANWNGGGLWILNDLYNAYDFTGDASFLEKAYPVMEGAARFVLGNLMRVEGNGGELSPYVVMAPSTSPEHWFLDGQKNYVGAVDIMTTGDLWACRNLFHILLKASDALQKQKKSVDAALVAQAKEALQKLPPVEMYIDTETGLLKEWYNEYRRGEDSHRHATHLMGFFFPHAGMPSSAGSKLYQAARGELKRLGDLGGGYHPDVVTMGIRAGMPAWGLGKILETDPEPWAKAGYIWKWFPISAPVVESLLDSRFGELNILPALPDEWKSGSVSGIRARGGAQLAITWDKGELVKCVIDLPGSTTPVIRYKGEKVDVSRDKRFEVHHH